MVSLAVPPKPNGPKWRLTLRPHEGPGSTVFIGEGETILQAIAALERSIHTLCETNLSEDHAVRWDDLFDNLSGGGEYTRNDFASPEDNYTITSEAI